MVLTVATFGQAHAVLSDATDFPADGLWKKIEVARGYDLDIADAVGARQFAWIALQTQVAVDQFRDSALVSLDKEVVAAKVDGSINAAIRRDHIWTGDSERAIEQHAESRAHRAVH